MDIGSTSSKKSESQYLTNNKGYSDKIINEDESNSIIKPINIEQEIKRDGTSDSTNENKKQKKSINESYGSTDKTKGNISYKVLFNKGTDSIDNFLLQIQYCAGMFPNKIKGLHKKFDPKKFNKRSSNYSKLGNCLVIGTDDKYYGISGSGDDGPKVKIPESSNGSKKIISMPRLLNPKEKQKYLYELDQLSHYVSEILKSLSEDKNNTQLIDVDTIKRCEKIPRDYMMVEVIITTIRHTTIEKEKPKIISEEVGVTIWGVFVVQSEKINENINMKIGKGILTSKTNSDDEIQVELQHLQLLIYNTESYTIKIHAENKKTKCVLSILRK